jgi:hypothetical protein
MEPSGSLPSTGPWPAVEELLNWRFPSSFATGASLCLPSDVCYRPSDYKASRGRSMEQGVDASPQFVMGRAV